jgi:antitoxin (DNA-binding transcriptional repressor) of toxin-antitoxin stability system
MNEILRVNVLDLRDDLASYLTQASHGDEVTVTSDGRPIAKKPRSALFGAMRGQISIAPDFDETPADILDAMDRP